MGGVGGRTCGAARLETSNSLGSWRLSLRSSRTNSKATQVPWIGRSEENKQGKKKRAEKKEMRGWKTSGGQMGDACL